MRFAGQVVIVICCTLVIAQAIVLWSATGRAGFTRYYDPARAARERQAVGVGELFAGTGLEDDTGSLTTVPNEFSLGLAPSGGGEHLLSVATLAGPATVAIVTVLIDAYLHRKRRKPVPGSH